MRTLLVCAVIAFASASVSTFGGGPQPAARGRTPVQPSSSPDAAFLKQYCVGCHNTRAKVGNLVLDAADPAHVEGQIATWEKVVRKLRTGMMPPEGAPQPPAAARAEFTSALEGQLDGFAVQHPDPGAPALHRLNRAEYANAIRDLLAVDVDVSAMLPPDDSAAGFDNNADVLGVSPALIEAYASAAAKVSRLAIGHPSIGLDRVTYRVPGDLSQAAHIEGLPLGTRGGLVIHHTFPLDAEYDLEVGAGGGAALGAARGAGGRGGGPAAADDRYVTLDGTAVTLQGRGLTRLRVSAGPHTLAAALIVRTRVSGVDSVYNAPTRTPGVSQVTITGPFGERVNNIDMRFAKIVRIKATKANVGVDLYNLTNANTPTTFESTYDPGTGGERLMRPTALLQPRFVRFNVQFDF
jgi:hypothetical protein